MQRSKWSSDGQHIDGDERFNYVAKVTALSPPCTLSRHQREWLADYVIAELATYCESVRHSIGQVAQSFMRIGHSENSAIVSAFTLSVIHGGSLH